MDRSRIRAPYPTLAPSSSSSAFQSSSSLASLPSPNAMSNQDHGGPQSAPLPSPTAEQRSFFASLNPTSPRTTTSQQIPPQHQQHQHFSQQPTFQPQSQMPQSPTTQHHPQAPLQQATQQPAVPQQMQTGWNYAPDRRGAGATNPETATFLRDYNLVAEAAKRAQVACMIRDLDAMDMS